MSERQEVMAAAQELIEAHNDADVDTLSKFWHPDCVFLTNKGFKEIHRVQSREHQQAQYDAGLSTDYHWEDLRVQTYGNAAVTGGFLCGFTQSAGAKRKACRIAYSIVWIKDSGQWRRVYGHLAPQDVPDQ